MGRHGGGWQAIAYTLRKGSKVGFLRLWRAMRSRNACKTCALGMGGQRGGMVNEAGHFPEVCKKSLQAMVADMQGRIERRFFETYSLDELSAFSSRELEAAGRIAEPMIARNGGTHYEPISWDLALEFVSSKMHETDPSRAFFYASGRSSNEAGFLLQLLGRCYGTNHVSNCSYYCHQASGVGLSESIGTGTATVTLEDLELCDLVFLIGGNPASNHPRLMSSLERVRRRGGEVIVVNPLREVGLTEFRVPSNLRSMLMGSPIASEYVQVKIGGDIACMAGVAKALIESPEPALDEAFVKAKTLGFEGLAWYIKSLSWAVIEQASGLAREQIERVARLYAKSNATIFAWTMGITHHEHGVQNVQWITNLALLRGMVGRPGAGLMPIRGHSNVQGLGSVGVYPGVRAAVLERLAELGVKPPEWKGYDTMAAMEASGRGEMDFALCLGGNLFGANPDASFAQDALSKVDTVVYLSTTLNTGHARGRGQTTLILPVCARDEEEQPTTQESMFNYVRVSDGGPKRLDGPRTEVDIIASLGEGLQPSASALDWTALKSHDAIRSLISSMVPGLEKLEEAGRTKTEFLIHGRTLHEATFPTKSGKASFYPHPIPSLPVLGGGQLRLMTIRSEGQFNTVVYEEEDIYRGQDRRDVILLNADDMGRLGIESNQAVEVANAQGTMRVVARPFDIAAGCAAMYYPEANILVPKTVDPRSKTPAYKSVIVSAKPFDGTLFRRETITSLKRGDLKAC